MKTLELKEFNLSDVQLVQLRKDELIDKNGGFFPWLVFGASLLPGSYILGKEIGRVW